MSIKLNAKSFRNLLETIVREEQKKINENVELTGGNQELEERFPKAFAALPSSYKNDSVLTYFIDEDGILCAQHDQGGIFVWTGRKWIRGDIEQPVAMESKKISVGFVKKIIKEELVRFNLKRTLTETVKKYFDLNEIVNFGALKKELESGFDHFKAENPDVKVKDFNWDEAIKGLMHDPEARKMMEIGDADGLVNKAIEKAGVENPLADVDVEKHTEDVFGNLEGDEDVNDNDVDAAFDNIQKKSA